MKKGPFGGRLNFSPREVREVYRSVHMYFRVTGASHRSWRRWIGLRVIRLGLHLFGARAVHFSS